MTAANHFVESQPPAVRAQLDPHLQKIELIQDRLITDIGAKVAFVVLPINAIISVITVMTDGDQVESRTIGREGGFGLLHALGSNVSLEKVTVQISGEAWRLPTNALRAAAAESPELTRAIVQHAQATIAQSAQFMACNTLHGAGARLARWLLMTSDRLASDMVPLTQEHLAIMLGVQRTTVTAMAQILQEQALIRYSRGKIQILDRKGLHGRSCECYDALNRSVHAILGEGDWDR